MLVGDRYRLGDPLGRGGMGEVYRAVDQVLDRQVAVKLMLPVRNTLAATERFQREARAAAALSDPHVVAAFDFGSHGDGFYLAMELVEGRTVSQELKRYGPLPADRAVDIIRQAAAGLAAAHRVGIVHRDIKPGNLLLADDGTVKVADFGIVRFLDDTTTTLTATGQIVGTSHYLSPERALGKPAEAPSDVYALGCVLYQLVTGHPPFLADDPASIMYQHVETTAVPPSDLRSELSDEFDSFLFWLLAKDPTQRPTAAQIANGARPPVTVHPTEAATTESIALPSEADTQPVEAPPFEVSRRPSRKLLATATAGATVALAIAATVGILLDANTLKAPATSNLGPDSSATTPAPKPSTPKTTTPKAAPTPSQTVAGTSAAPQPTARSTQPSNTSKPTKTPPTKGPKKPKPSKPPHGGKP
ncbi:serine/threonine-protein kinase [Kribbella sp. VKM Ac-2568]|uniref:serine/threonine-protein kinase n=1 Tax=Kribbella sp. VKM Ac-2568 TaxID=2512219 RepID=UPI0010EFAC03|nr:serine/threonine-protein kinase [Kribbella sp. VKM Ac-2568]TCM46675.1 serine/threonine-protein kinase [Kribbella sp. VKM Ac-2568]